MSSAFVYRIPRHRRVLVADEHNEGANQQQASTSVASGSRKRRLNTNDIDFLNTDALPAVSHFAVPSSDLLKCIHHFASNYYEERGQLYNDSRTYRKQKTARRRAKKARLENPDAHVDDSEEQEDESPKQAANTTRRRDMYKTMDGSALLAVGMLLQEHIARTLATRKATDWKEGEEEADEDYSDDGGQAESDVDDDETDSDADPEK
ncbi:hypothetical protein HMN09_00714400 [Mycena chlorophos]|uniref:Uncharacterized protein n=1 Tax=Mycena chlorophos TaxID=658473 RepID=A0A8H6T3A1_MYCCL|nr:hypothetical protein HMN09_00714400 [Mycena chlorophos]